VGKLYRIAEPDWALWGGRMPNAVTVTLTREEAIVLFELLSRHSDTDKLTIEDRAEDIVLWRMCGMLERTLVEPFDREYKSILSRARDAVQGAEGAG
jgi:hypothetical protein